MYTISSKEVRSKVFYNYFSKKVAVLNTTLDLKQRPAQQLQFPSLEDPISKRGDSF